METTIGTVLGGRYKLVSLVDEEVLGRVFLAEDSQAGGRKVRVKVLHPFLSDNKEKAARFEREVTASAKLAHPNLLQMLDEGRQFGVTWLVLEHFESTPLKEELDKGPLDPVRAAHIVAQAARALEAAHAQGVFHRNLGPQNLMLVRAPDGSDFVKVRDFGLAAVADEEGKALTSAAARIGNIAYMSPEYIEEGNVDASTDIYALGALLFQMITGRAPFVGKYGQVVDAHMSAAPPPAATLRPDAPAWVDRVVARLMAKDPAQRPQSGGEVAALLEEATGQDLAAPDLTGKRPASRAPRSRVPAVAAAGTMAAGAMGALVLGALVLLVLAVGGVWYLLR